MRTSVQIRLSLTTLAVLLLGMGLAALLAWLAVEQLYLNTQKENLLAQAQLTASALQDTPLLTAPVEPYSQTSNALPGVHARLLGEQGAVVVALPMSAEDAPVQVPLAENAASVSTVDLLQRPEIQSALSGIPSQSTQESLLAFVRRSISFLAKSLFLRE